MWRLCPDYGRIIQNPDVHSTSAAANCCYKILSLPYQVKTNVCSAAACFSADMVYTFLHIGALSRYERSDLMSAKRRDNRNRILRNGESQRKDGRYMYKYIDNAGNAKYVYSWKLVKTDTVPQGAKNDVSLRDKEKQIHKDLEDDIVSLGGGMTVLELVKNYISQKTGVRHNTEANYNFVINIIKKEAFGNKRIDKVKLSERKRLADKATSRRKRLQYHTYCKRCGKTCVSDGG